VTVHESGLVNELLPEVRRPQISSFAYPMAAGMDQGSVSGKEQPSMTKLGSGEERPSSMEQPGTTKSEVGGTVEEIGAGHIIDGKIKPKGKLDAAAEFLRLHEGEHVDFTKKEANHVRWKADLRILPLMTGTVVLTAVDVSLEIPQTGDVWN
jgi:hypothetical protein